MKLFCRIDHDELVYQAQREERDRYERLRRQDREETISRAIRTLYDVDGKIGVAIRVETTNSGAIKTVIAELEKSIANKIIGDAKTALYKLIINSSQDK